MQLFDGVLQLGDGSADVRQFDDVGVGGLGQFTQLRQEVGNLLLFGQAFGKVRDDAAREGDVPGFNIDAGSLKELLHHGEQGVGRQRRGFVNFGPDNRCCFRCHVLSLVFMPVSPELRAEGRE